MTDRGTEGVWRFKTDSAEVIWKNWVNWPDLDNPNGGRDENCAMMIKQLKNEDPGWDAKGWIDSSCSVARDDTSVVCEKGKDVL